MNREEIRKKWKNRELAEISQKKLVRQEDTQVSPTKNVSQGSSWERVQNTANKILSNPSQMTGISNVKNAKSTSFLENTKKNLSAIASNFGLGVKDSGIDLAYMIDRQTYRNSPEYRSINKRQQAQEEKKEQLDKLKQGLEGKASFTPTAENLRKTETKTVGLIPQRDTREKTVFQRGANRILEQDEQKIQKNIDSTTNKVARKVAELTPSMAQSATGMAISALNPVLRNRVFYGKCWRWIYKTSFGYGL